MNHDAAPRASSLLSVAACLLLATGCESAPETAGRSNDRQRDVPAVSTTDQEGEDARAGSTRATSEEREAYRFVAVGDTGVANPAQERVVRGIQRRCDRAGGCRGLLLLGDAIYGDPPEGPDDAQFEERLDEPLASLSQGAPPEAGKPDDRPRLPVYFTLGNHDLGDDEEYDEGRIDYFREYARDREWFHFPGETWSTRIGFVQIVAANTTPIDDYERKVDEQGRFLTRTTDPGADNWSVLLAHDPYRSNALHGNADEAGELRGWVEEYVCGRFDFYLSGHDHNRQWLGEVPKLSNEDRTCRTQFAVSGATALPRDLREMGNEPAFASGELGFLFLQFERDRVLVEFCDADGDTEWTTVVQR